MTEKQALVLLICFILIWGGFALDLIIWKIKKSKSMENRNYKECAIEHLKQGNLCKGYIDYILGEMEKLEKIEQIVNEWNEDASNSFGDMCKIKGILKE